MQVSKVLSVHTAATRDGARAPVDPKSVVVLGAGLAGLTAADALKRDGYAVTVLEAQQRVGGRVFTWRDGFEGGQYAELGAVRVPDVHDRTLALARRLGLTTSEFPPGDPVYHLNGERFIHRAGQPWQIRGLNALEREKGPDALAEYQTPFLDEVGDPRAGTFPTAEAVEKYDDLTHAEFLRSKGATEAFVKLYEADNGTEGRTVGALPVLGGEAADRLWDKTFHIDGGNDLLPRGLAAELGDRVRLGHVVTQLEHGPESVAVHFDHAGKRGVVRAAHCVSAIPFTTLRDVTIEPAFSADKTRAIAELQMMPSSRAYFQTRSRFWKDEGLGGLKLARTDTGAERIFDLSEVQAPSTQGMITAYLMDENALRFSALPSAARRGFIEREIAKFFPQLGAEAVAYKEHSWQEDPWAKGAWSIKLPGQSWMYEVVPRAEGRVHFAGEHTSHWWGWMQGAIESGERAAREIVEFDAAASSRASSSGVGVRDRSRAAL